MIAKPSITVNEARNHLLAQRDQFDAYPEDMKSSRLGLSLMEVEIRQFHRIVDAWREYRNESKKAAVEQARHQRPSVRRHITRKVKLAL